MLLCGILFLSISITGIAKDGVDKNKMTDEGLTERERTEEDKLRYMEQRTRAEHGRFILQGEVVDENGMRLNSVTLELEKVKLKNFGWETEDEEETLTVNGTFQLDLKGYAAVRLYFSKDGYYSEKTHFSMPEVPAEMSAKFDEAIEEGKDISEKDLEQRVFKKDDIRIVLEKQGKITHLIDYNGSLEYTTSGKGIIIDFDTIPGNYEGISEFRMVDNIHDLKQLPANCVYMVAEKDERGKIANMIHRFSYKAPEWFNPVEYNYLIPKKIKMSIRGEDSGFVEYIPDPNKKIGRQMKEAIETGYKNEIIIDNEWFKEACENGQSGKSSGKLFYFKVKGKYGKGSIGFGGDLFPRMPDTSLWDRQEALKEGMAEKAFDTTMINLGVSFSLQPDGSRNLETGDR